VVSVTDPYGRILGFPDRSVYTYICTERFVIKYGRNVWIKGTRYEQDQKMAVEAKL
jgi:hypothetical protein